MNPNNQEGQVHEENGMVFKDVVRAGDTMPAPVQNAAEDVELARQQVAEAQAAPVAVEQAQVAEATTQVAPVEQAPLLPPTQNPSL